MLPIEPVSIDVGRKSESRVVQRLPRSAAASPLAIDRGPDVDPDVREALRHCYGDDIDKVELFPGLFAEDVRDRAARCRR